MPAVEGDFVESTNAHALPGLAGRVLRRDPHIGFRKAFVQGRVRFPCEDLLDERVVGVAAGHTLGCVEVIFPIHFHTRDCFDLRKQFVDRNQFARAEVDRRSDQVVAVCDHVNTFHAVVNIHEAACLRAVAPDRDVIRIGVYRLDDLATECGGGFFAAAVPGAVRAIDIVETGDEGLHAAFVPIFFTEHFGDELFPAVAAFGHCRVGVGFLERADVGVFLQQGIVGTSGA